MVACRLGSDSSSMRSVMSWGRSSTSYFRPSKTYPAPKSARRGTLNLFQSSRNVPNTAKDMCVNLVVRSVVSSDGRSTSYSRPSKTYPAPKSARRGTLNLFLTPRSVVNRPTESPIKPGKRMTSPAPTAIHPGDCEKLLGPQKALRYSRRLFDNNEQKDHFDEVTTDVTPHGDNRVSRDLNSHWKYNVVKDAQSKKSRAPGRLWEGRAAHDAVSMSGVNLPSLRLSIWRSELPIGRKHLRSQISSNYNPIAPFATQAPRPVFAPPLRVAQKNPSPFATENETPDQPEIAETIFENRREIRSCTDWRDRLMPILSKGQPKQFPVHSVISNNQRRGLAMPQRPTTSRWRY
eukprot:GEMP01025136.1.p1 GENE.GEMP01025136.1~~GEMP01025136.1.p1  ORF type:complete len:359 (+),score=51.36 GEMP01025136.1:36-1079(+)